MKPPRAPSGLTPATRRWWNETVAEYELEPQHFKLLEAACRAWDRTLEARELLAREGIVYRDRFGAPRPHPAVAIERDSRIAFARLVRELDLDGEPAPDPRPPRRGR